MIRTSQAHPQVAFVGIQSLLFFLFFSWTVTVQVEQISLFCLQRNKNFFFCEINTLNIKKLGLGVLSIVNNQYTQENSKYYHTETNLFSIYLISL